LSADEPGTVAVKVRVASFTAILDAILASLLGRSGVLKYA
jgi:hypothetical protein